MAVITLLSDFGTIDGYVGAMKGVILSIAPTARLLDITHAIEPQDIRAAAWALRHSVPYFPAGTIHVAVVDPGVGTQRRPILLRDGGQLLIGPDNGLFDLVAHQGAEVWELDRPELFQPHASATFHGRDIFASVAGHLAAGRAPASCGTPIDDWRPTRHALARRDGDRLVGEVVHVDRFGNLISNVGQEELVDVVDWSVTLGTRRIGAIRRTYGDVGIGEWVAYLGSAGLLEVAIRDGDAAASGFGRGSQLVCERACEAT